MRRSVDIRAPVIKLSTAVDSMLKLSTKQAPEVYRPYRSVSIIGVHHPLQSITSP